MQHEMKIKAVYFDKIKSSEKMYGVVAISFSLNSVSLLANWKNLFCDFEVMC